MTTATSCPECDVDVHVDQSATEPGDLMVCDGCGAELEVLDIEQPRLALAAPVEEDWGE
jgi:alpha-aminoadipate/glutamate carrier protein LysW